MTNERMIEREVNDLGAGAYLLMFHYKPVGRKHNSIIFRIEEKELDDFEAKHMEYLTSDFHRFDSCLMSLKKLSEYKNR